MNKLMIQSNGYVLLAGLMLAMSSTLFAADNNPHFSGNLLSKSCVLVVGDQYLAEVRFSTISCQDLNVTGQPTHAPVVFKLEDCKKPAGYNIKVILTGVENSEQSDFPVLDTSSTAQGVGIGMEKTGGMQIAINNANEVTSVLTSGNNDTNFRAWLQVESDCNVTIGEFTVSLTAAFEYI